jgi:hypothetical protein
MIKNLIILVLLLAVLVLLYPIVRPYINSYLTERNPPAPQNATTTPIVVPEIVPESVATQEEKKEVVIDETGGLHDGPFTVWSEDGVNTGATAYVIYSPEETLIEFRGVPFLHSAEVEIHLAKDLKGKEYLNLGSARVRGDVRVYGLPLDVDLSVFKYLLFYNPNTNINEFVVNFK